MELSPPPPPFPLVNVSTTKANNIVRGSRILLVLCYMRKSLETTSLINVMGKFLESHPGLNSSQY